jgi:hypothetical protein
MRSTTLPLLRPGLGGSVPEGLRSLGRWQGVGQAFPGTLSVARPLRVPLVARGRTAAATPIAYMAFPRVVGPRQARPVIAVDQAGPLAPADHGEGTATRGTGRGDRRLPLSRGMSAASWSRALVSLAGVRGHGCAEGGEVPEPGGALVAGLGGLRTGRSGCLATVRPLGEPCVIALGEPGSASRRSKVVQVTPCGMTRS